MKQEKKGDLDIYNKIFQGKKKKKRQSGSMSTALSKNLMLKWFVG